MNKLITMVRIIKTGNIKEVAGYLLSFHVNTQSSKASQRHLYPEMIRLTRVFIYNRVLND